MEAVTPQQIKRVYKRARCLHTQQEVEAALDNMASDIRAALEDSNPILLCIMHGGLIVTGRLATRLQFPLQIDYLHATRYREKTIGSDLQWRSYPSLSLEGRQVLIVDDILDKGATLQSVFEYCKEQGAKRVLTAVLVVKQHSHKCSTLTADFVGMEVEDYYLFGYGMDYKGYLRNAAGIYAVDEADR